MSIKENQQELAMIKAAYLAKYGMQMDDWTAVMMLDYQIQFERLNHQLQQSMDQNIRLAENFRGPINQLHFNSHWQSFFNGLGSSLANGIWITTLIICCYTYMSTHQDYQNLKKTLSAYKHVGLYANLIQQGEVKTENGMAFLILSQSKDGEQIPGKTYELDNRKKKIKVPLIRQH